ncbi:MAG TPA: heavy metal-binding domain-containing protein [Solirubrobacteraceae bacterium]|jgi:uncharacterized protein YbjQ (UPF0145 family)
MTPDSIEPASIDLDESLRRVEAGGIPLLAKRRLEETRQAGAFTSDLSVADFALCHQLGLSPLSQVMGTCIYQIGYQPLGAGMYGEIGELRTLTQAWNQARDRAFARLAEEAQCVGANAVVGVEVKSSVGNWGETTGYGSIEYVITGTAVARDHAAAKHTAKHTASQAPVITELTVADYAKLLAAGIEPVGIVAWTSVFFVSLLNIQAERPMFGGSSFQNYEYQEVTQCFYGARERVTGQLGTQAQALGASGIVGVRIAHTISTQRVGGGVGQPERTGLIASFSALGTAVLDHGAEIPNAPQPTIDLST